VLKVPKAAAAVGQQSQVVSSMPSSDKIPPPASEPVVGRVQVIDFL
jgi:hypothetical protein